MIITICGPSGSGKDTLANYLLKSFPYNVKKLPSYTTRSMRPGEKDGVDYNFISKEKFEDMIKNDELLEYDEYTPGIYYGTGKEDLVNAANSVIMYVMVKTPIGVKAIEDAIDRDKLLKVGLMVSDDVKRQRFIARAGDTFDNHEKENLEYRLKNDKRVFSNLAEISDVVFVNNAPDISELYSFGDRIFIEANDIIQHIDNEIEEPDR